MAATVTAAACTVYLKSGAATLLYRGAVLPPAGELREGEAKRLKDGGFVGSEDDLVAQPAEGTVVPEEKPAPRKS